MRIRVQIGETIDVVGNGVRASVPYPGAGCGGHHLIVSPSQRYLVLHLFSGQGEFGWELFELPRLRRIGGLPYVRGEGYPPVFSADERWVATISTLRDIGPDDDDPDAVEIDWAEVRLQPVAAGPLAVCTLRLRFGAPPAEREPEYPQLIAVRPPNAIEVLLPWGARCTLPFPLPMTLVVPGPE